MKGGGVLLPGDVCTKTGRTVEYVLKEKQSDIRVNPVENPMCVSLEEYKEVLETVKLEFSEDDITWMK